MKQKLFRSLADLRFAISILLIIALFSIIGTVIEQDQSIETCQSISTNTFQINPSTLEIESAKKNQYQGPRGILGHMKCQRATAKASSFFVNRDQ